MDNVAVERQNLSTASLNAALQIDEILNEDSKATTDIKAFAQLLSDVSGIRADTQMMQLHSDPMTVNLFNRAVHDVPNEQITNINQLGGKIHEFLCVMGRGESFEEEGALREIRGFCLSLHRALIEQELGVQGKARPSSDVLTT